MLQRFSGPSHYKYVLLLLLLLLLTQLAEESTALSVCPFGQVMFNVVCAARLAICRIALVS